MISKQDYELLSHLRDNARISLVTIGNETEVSLSTVYDKIRRFERDFIKKHTSLLDFKKLGFNLKVNIVFKVKKGQIDDFYDFLIDCRHINNFYKTNEDYDFLVEGIFKDQREFNEFLIRINEEFLIEHKQIFYLVEDVKEQSFLGLNQLY